MGSFAEGVGGADQAATRLNQQQADVSIAKDTVPEPLAHPFDPVAAQQRLMTITDPAALVGLANQDQAEYEAQLAARQHAVSVVLAHDRDVAETFRNQHGRAVAPPAAKPADALPPGSVARMASADGVWAEPSSGQMPAQGANRSAGSGGDGYPSGAANSFGYDPGEGADESGSGGRGSYGTGSHGSTRWGRREPGRTHWGPSGSRSTAGAGAEAAERSAIENQVAEARTSQNSAGRSGPAPSHGGEDEPPKYLIEPDRSGVFDSDERTVPPVIG